MNNLNIRAWIPKDNEMYYLSNCDALTKNLDILTKVEDNTYITLLKKEEIILMQSFELYGCTFYEKDILLIDGYRYIVNFSGGLLSFNGDALTMFPFDMTSETKIKVIGNVYEGVKENDC